MDARRYNPNHFLCLIMLCFLVGIGILIGICIREAVEEKRYQRYLENKRERKRGRV